MCAALPLTRRADLSPLQISLETRDVFIEVTSTDRHKGDIVLSTLCAMYSAHCAVPYEVEPVEVTDALGTTRGEHQSLCPCVCWSPSWMSSSWAVAVLLQSQWGDPSFCWLHGSRTGLLCAP